MNDTFNDVIKDADSVEEMEWEESVSSGGEGEFDSCDPNMCGEYSRDVFANEMVKREPKWVMLTRWVSVLRNLLSFV